MEKLCIGILVFFSFSTSCLAQIYNTPYLPITELKVWQNTFDVYHGTTNECPNPKHKKRYVLAITKKSAYAGLLTAMVAKQAVSLAYTCNRNGYPEIVGVRIRAK